MHIDAHDIWRSFLELYWMIIQCVNNIWTERICIIKLTGALVKREASVSAMLLDNTPSIKRDNNVYPCINVGWIEFKLP